MENTATQHLLDDTDQHDYTGDMTLNPNNNTTPNEHGDVPQWDTSFGWVLLGVATGIFLSYAGNVSSNLANRISILELIDDDTINCNSAFECGLGYLSVGFMNSMMASLGNFLSTLAFPMGFFIGFNLFAERNRTTLRNCANTWLNRRVDESNERMAERNPENHTAENENTQRHQTQEIL